MTADSLHSQTADAFGAYPTAAAELSLISDLMAGARQPASITSEDPVQIELEAIERAFGRQILDERARSGVEAARTRALHLAQAAGGSTHGIAIAFAADLFVSLAVERAWRQRDLRELVPALSAVLGFPEKSVETQLLMSSLRAPQLFELPPAVALEVQIQILVVLSPAAEASVWLKETTGRPECLASVGATATTRRFRTTALQILEGRGAEERGTIVGSAIRRWQRPWGALVVRARTRESVESLLGEAADAIGVIAERAFLIERSAARERSLVSASERRLSRLGFDLHDGALQHIAALSRDVRQLRPVSGPEIASVESRLSELDRILRELAHSLEPASLLRRPLPLVVETEVAMLAERTGIDVHTRVAGDFGALTPSQKIALIRVLQEALTNIREHSNASTVAIVLTASRSCVELHVEDDGDGFEVSRTLLHAAQRGRLGIVGSSERVRLLGGTFDISSRPGGPTRVSLTLPRWQPLVAEQSGDAADFPLGLAD
jgi:signal transduction histidine kinase